MNQQTMLFFIIVIIISAILHEYSHGWVAEQLGDPTARYAGRLTLNPLAHIDLFGSIILPLLFVLSGSGFLFAYAKPVPYNPYNLRNQKWGPGLVALAGPFSNLILAFIFGLAIRFFPLDMFSPFFSIVVQANVALAIFNLVPIPPLDGSKVLFSILPDSMQQFKITLERFGFFFLIMFILFFSPIIYPIIQAVYQLLVGG